MRHLPARCPICASNDIQVTRFECPQCNSAVTGSFRLHRLNRLTHDQLLFVETFLLNEGKINRVEQEMGLSYTAVRARLQDIIDAIGSEPAGEGTAGHPHSSEAAVNPEKRKEILARVSTGDLTAAEAALLLRGD